MRPRTIAWNQQSAKQHPLNSVGFVLASMRSWLKEAQQRRRFDLMSAGASLATLMHDCMSDSGMFFQDAKGGGSAEMKVRKSSCASSCTTSSRRSRLGTQLCMRWQFWSIAQPPSLAKRSTTASAGFSWPWPIEMLMNLPFSIVKPFVLPMASTHGVGSTPAKSTKKVGVCGSVSSYNPGMSSGGCCTYTCPISCAIHVVSKLEIRSGRSARSSRILWNIEMSLRSPGTLALSQCSLSK